MQSFLRGGPSFRYCCYHGQNGGEGGNDPESDTGG